MKYFFETYILLYLKIGSIIYPNHLISFCFLKDKNILM